MYRRDSGLGSQLLYCTLKCSFIYYLFFFYFLLVMNGLQDVSLDHNPLLLCIILNLFVHTDVYQI